MKLTSENLKQTTSFLGALHSRAASTSCTLCEENLSHTNKVRVHSRGALGQTPRHQENNFFLNSMVKTILSFIFKNIPHAESQSRREEPKILFVSFVLSMVKTILSFIFKNIPHAKSQSRREEPKILFVSFVLFVVKIISSVLHITFKSFLCALCAFA